MVTVKIAFRFAVLYSIVWPPPVAWLTLVSADDLLDPLYRYEDTLVLSCPTQATAKVGSRHNIVTDAP